MRYQSPAEVVIAEAKRLRGLGWNPIPINNGFGHCPVPHTAYRDLGMSPRRFERIVHEKQAHGLQIPVGTRWRLAVVDIDGEAGAEEWARLAASQGSPRTVAGITPRNGHQLWFSIPPFLSRIPSFEIWHGEGNHQGIELLADKGRGSCALARCWPSYKTLSPEPGVSLQVDYRWVDGQGPGEIRLASLPGWLISRALEVVAQENDLSQPLAVDPRIKLGAYKGKRNKLSSQSRGRTHWTEVRDKIQDKASIASSWGLRIVGMHASRGGWVTCRSIFREDRHPSARFNVNTGGYWEAHLGGIFNFFNLAIALGVGPNFKTVVEKLEKQCRA